jgi:hypothetical protein
VSYPDDGVKRVQELAEAAVKSARLAATAYGKASKTIDDRALVRGHFANAIHLLDRAQKELERLSSNIAAIPVELK